jgi:hypothetical protein
MHRRTVVAFITALVLVLLPLVAFAGEGGVNARDLGAYANFASADPADPACTVNYAGITAVESRLHPGAGQPDFTVWVDVYLSRYSHCNGYQQLVDATGRVDVGKAALQVNGSLDGARLRATVPVYDTVSGTTFPVAIDISFTSDGDLVVSADGKYRDAAATGHVVAQGIDYATDQTIGGSLWLTQPH